jgi:hypothetical protein
MRPSRGYGERITTSRAPSALTAVTRVVACSSLRAASEAESAVRSMNRPPLFSATCVNSTGSLRFAADTL